MLILPPIPEVEREPCHSDHCTMRTRPTVLRSPGSLRGCPRTSRDSGLDLMRTIPPGNWRDTARPFPPPERSSEDSVRSFERTLGPAHPC